MLCKLWRICCAMWGIVMIATILRPAGEIGSGKTGRQPRAAEPGGWLISLPADKVGKALWLISEKEPGKHRENSVEKTDEPTVGILYWGLETWAPGRWKHWRESKESDALHSRTKGPAWEGVHGKRVGFGYQEIVLVFPGSSKEKMLLECALAWRVPGNRALHRDLETLPWLWVKKTVRDVPDEGEPNFATWTKESLCLLGCFWLQVTRKLTRLRSLLPP